MTRSDLRNHLERWQAVYRTREYRMIKKSSAKKPEIDKDKKIIDLKELTPIPKSQVPKSILNAATTLCEDLPKSITSNVNHSPGPKKLIVIAKQNKSWIVIKKRVNKFVRKLNMSFILESLMWSNICKPFLSAKEKHSKSLISRSDRRRFYIHSSNKAKYLKSILNVYGHNFLKCVWHSLLFHFNNLLIEKEYNTENYF